MDNQQEINMLHSVINEYKLQQLKDENTINILKEKILDLKDIIIMTIDKIPPK
tara:strand:+ start:736 stop:894 length:159 start_codon:yes stop_codon:yes gene_type:complete